MKDETEIWFDSKGKGHAFDDEYSVTIHHDTEEEMEKTVEFLKHRAFWTPAAEAPKKDGEWSLEEEAILAWARLPEPCGRSQE